MRTKGYDAPMTLELERADLALDTTFGGLTVRFDRTVLRPRDWTIAQTDKAVRLLSTLAAGPVLELCAGVGHIGLAAIAQRPRLLVQVDSSERACAFAEANAATAGLSEFVDVRCGSLEEALDPREQFALVIADPPWVRQKEVGLYLDDPATAIDGGPEGLDVARSCLALMRKHLLPHGAGILQLGDIDQVVALYGELPAYGLRSVSVDAYGGQGVLMELRRV